MSEAGDVGLYNDPVDDRYEQRGNGRWYLKLHGVNKVHLGVFRPSKMILVDHPVGDVSSDERGSGARALGEGKYPLDLIPVRHWVLACMANSFEVMRRTGMVGEEGSRLIVMLQALSEFQEGKANGRELMRSVPVELYTEAAQVFDYGRNKYAAWNWLKGMQWSIPIGCAVRHMKAIFFDYELLDPESGLSHLGHFVCNIIMLATFYDTYPEGNDLPNEDYFNG